MLKQTCRYDCISPLPYIRPSHEKTSLCEFATGSDSNQSSQLQRLARSLKVCISQTGIKVIVLVKERITKALNSLRYGAGWSAPCCSHVHVIKSAFLATSPIGKVLDTISVTLEKVYRCWDILFKQCKISEKLFPCC